MSLMCILWIMFISWSYFGADIVNDKITILYIVGLLVAVWVLLKCLLTIVYVRENEIKYQSVLIPFIYKRTNFSKIKTVKIVTRSTNEGTGEPYNIMIFYGEKRKMFSVLMGTINCKKLYQATASYYGIQIEDLTIKCKQQRN